MHSATEITRRQDRTTASIVVEDSRIQERTKSAKGILKGHSKDRDSPGKRQNAAVPDRIQENWAGVWPSASNWT